MNRYFVALIGTLLAPLSLLSQGQIAIEPLNGNFALRARAAQRGGLRAPDCPPQTLSVPFFDDFAYPGPYPDCAKWADQLTYVNSTYGLNNPSIGVATLDGLNDRGFPYQPGVNASVPCDTLTSQFIDLSSLGVAFLYFERQSKGYGNAPENNDTLLLEFRNSAGNWIRMGAYTLNDTPIDNTFYGTRITINDAQFLHGSFQFRFRNYATAAGNNDHWNLDYVLLDDGPIVYDPVTNVPIFQDVALSQIPVRLLDGYTAMPLDHFRTAVGSLLVDALPVQVDNRFDSDKKLNKQLTVRETTTNTEILNSGVFSLADAAPGINDYATSVGVTYADVYDEPFLTSFTGDSAILELQYGFTIDATTETPDFARNNFAARQTVLDDYFAYDDGSAEGRFRLTEIGSQVALRFTALTDDSLRGWYIHLPYVDRDPATVNTVITVKVWLDSLAVGTEALEDNIRPTDFDYETYVDSLNGWWTYKFSSPVAVSAGQTFYVGWKNLGSQDELRVGWDVNTPDGAAHLFQNVLGFWEPVPANLSGSLLLRPILGADPIEISSLQPDPSAPGSALRVFPNPAHGSCRIVLENALDRQAESLQISDMLGKTVRSQAFGPELSLEGLANGLYLITVLDVHGKPMARTQLSVCQP
jgi:hypothetical protein